MRSTTRPSWSPPVSAFAGFRFPPEVIIVAVRWYLRFNLCYRDVEELLVERGVEVDHVTVFRWVQRFIPLLAHAAHSQLKQRLRPMRGLRTDRTAQVIIAGHAFTQNLPVGTTSSQSTSPAPGGWRRRSPRSPWRSDREPRLGAP
jgi:hypothetical protein